MICSFEFYDEKVTQKIVASKHEILFGQLTILKKVNVLNNKEN